jgi:hypothetical protein
MPTLQPFRLSKPRHRADKLTELRNRAPDRFGPYIMEGLLTAAHGKIKQEGSEPDHHEWWAYDGVERHVPFRVIETLER